VRSSPPLNAATRRVDDMSLQGADAAEAVRRLELEDAERVAEYTALHRELDEWRRATAVLMAEHDAIVNSVSWQTIRRVQSLSARLPRSLRSQGRRVLKALWWVATPWKMPQRLEILRQRRKPDAVEPILMDSVAPLPVSLYAEQAYQNWISAFDDVEDQSAAPADGLCLPQFSILLPDSGTDATLASDEDDTLTATLASLKGQGFSHWECLVAVPAGGLVDEDPRVIGVTMPASARRGAVLAALAARAQGHFVTVLDRGDRLAQGSLAAVAQAIDSRPEIAALYGDEDEMTAEGRRSRPQFKPSWSPQLLQAYNYFGRGAFLSRSILLDAGGFRPTEAEGAEWSLNLRLADHATTEGRTIERLTRVLCHRAPGGDRNRPEPTSTAAKDHRAVLLDYWTGHGIPDPQVETQSDGTQRSFWTSIDEPLVSVIIPNRNSPDMLRRCVMGLLEETAYGRIDIIVVENNSDEPAIFDLYAELERDKRVRIVPFLGAFNYSAVCNHGARAATGELLLFLNNDIEVVEKDWLSELVRVACLPGVGIVGAKLRYPTGELQHAGVGVGIHLYALLSYRADERDWGVFGSTNQTRNWLAVMGACQMVRRGVFDRIGGFDEAYRVADSDVALCLRAHRAGWRTAYTPFAVLTHHEGASRGFENPWEDTARSALEVQRLGLDEDPYLHPALSPHHPRLQLRAPAEVDIRQNLRATVLRVLADHPLREIDLDLYNLAEVQAVADLPSSALLWAPQTDATIADHWAAARWIIDLLRTRPDLRQRFPKALSEGVNGAFALWLLGAGGKNLGLSPEAQRHVSAAFEGKLAAECLRTYFFRGDLRAAYPLGLTPAGRSGWATWLLRSGGKEAQLRLEEIWWFLLSTADDPAAALVTTYRFTPDWQRAHPAGLTRFGGDAFALWLSERHLIASSTSWLRPEHWVSGLTPSEEIKLAYAARADWQTRHPDAFATVGSAEALLRWLGGEGGNLPAGQAVWCAERAGDGTAERLVRPGINILGHFCYPSGLRVSAESLSAAIEVGGGTVSRRDIRTTAKDEPRHDSFGGLEVHDVTIIHAQPDPHFVGAYELADLAKRSPRPYRIGYWYWEFGEVPPHWADRAKTVDEVWTATRFVADALRKTLTVPVHTLFPGVRLAPFKVRTRSEFQLPGWDDTRFTFLFSFHMSSIMERKNPLGLIRAFRQAFHPSEPVDLIMKTTDTGYDGSEVEELLNAIEDANIHIIHQTFTADETLSLTQACDAYVSLHRSEGLGLTMAEAMMLGKPVIATRYSGNLDFMTDDNSMLVDCQIVPLGREIPPYEAAYQWAEPSIDHAAQLMRELYDNPARAEALGRRAKADAQKRLSVEAASNGILDRLRDIRASESRRSS
jgi:GT2 family glycosyltransferase/glycosyltransferase involved in cell wall biosynthesis